MKLIDAGNAEQYLRESGRLPENQPVVISELAGGVSNIVLLIATPAGEPLFVLKQAREQLRVADPWFCSVTRIWREVEVLELCRQSLAGDWQIPPSEVTADETVSASGDRWSVAVPAVLFCDRENYLFAMTAAPRHVVWKQPLLDGNCNPEIAAACGRLLGRLHAATWQDKAVAARLGDRTFFDQLRLDPYYRHVARRHTHLAVRLEQLIASVEQHPRCIVHGDFSPKNILVFDQRLMLVDCEVGHYGDPAFDIGFFLSHLMLKAFRAGSRWWNCGRLTYSFWNEYQRQLAPVAGDAEYASVVERGIQNFAGCLLARVDGKSKVDYLDAPKIRRVRDAGSMLLGAPLLDWSQVIASLLPLL